MRPTRRQLRETKPLLFSLTPALSQSLLRVATRTRLSNRDWGGPKKQRKTNFILSYGSYRSFSFEIRQRSDHLKTARQIHVQRNPLSSAEASFCCGRKRERTWHDVFSIITIFIGIPSGSLCGGESNETQAPRGRTGLAQRFYSRYV